MEVLKDFQEEMLVTGEGLYRRPDLGPCELVDGRIVPLSRQNRSTARPSWIWEVS